MKTIALASVTFGLVLLMLGCHSHVAVSIVQPDKAVAQDQWIGKWVGPEGTYLVLTKQAAHYTVEIHSLDGPNTYEGVARGDSIDFVRNGKTESLHAGSGKDTGMKWLLDKKRCLVVQAGEGFCRD
jgi:hypothetical protein